MQPIGIINKPTLIDPKRPGLRKKGRPKSNNLKQQITFWVTKNQKTLIDDAAYKAGKPLSVWCRDTMEEVLNK